MSTIKEEWKRIVADRVHPEMVHFFACILREDRIAPNQYLFELRICGWQVGYAQDEDRMENLSLRERCMVLTDLVDILQVNIFKKDPNNYFPSETFIYPERQN